MAIIRVGKRCKIKTISEALEQVAKPGDIIQVSPGRYEEAVDISLPNITIEGPESPIDPEDSVLLVPPSNTQWPTVHVHAEHGEGATLVNLSIEGQAVHASDQDDDWPSAVLIEATNVTVDNCIIQGRASLGVTVEAAHATIRNCGILVRKSAVLVTGPSASIQIKDCRIKSTDDTGVWLQNCGRCDISDTDIDDCKRNGLYVCAAASRISNVQVLDCKRCGVLIDWPNSFVSPAETTALGTQGHEIRHLNVKACGYHGLEIAPSIRIHCIDSVLTDNGGSGIHFHRPSEQDQEESCWRDRIAVCQPSLIEQCTVVGNESYGIHAEIKGDVLRQGVNIAEDNGEGNFKNVLVCSKRKRLYRESTAEDTNQKREFQNKVSLLLRHKQSMEETSLGPRVNGAPVTATTSEMIGHVGNFMSLGRANGAVGSGDVDVVSSSSSGIPSEGTQSALHEKIKQQQQWFDGHRDEIPVAIVARKAGIRVPQCWPPGLIFLGNNNVSGMPPIHELHSWYLTHKVRANNNVRIQPSPGRGLGCFAARKLRKGATIGFYCGKLREHVRAHSSQYIANYCKPNNFHSPGEWEVDSEYGGNEMRFINYPNEGEIANVEAVSTLHDSLPVIAIKILTKVKEGEELLWDYGNEYFNNMELQQDPS